MDHPVAKQNIARFTGQLRLATDATRRQWRALLIREEDQLGFSVEQLDYVDGEIAEWAERIKNQQVLIEVLERNGRDATVAKSLLENLKVIQSAYARYRRAILVGVERNGR
jgi:hypothetical protein